MTTDIYSDFIQAERIVSDFTHSQQLVTDDLVVNGVSPIDPDGKKLWTSTKTLTPEVPVAIFSTSYVPNAIWRLHITGTFGFAWGTDSFHCAYIDQDCQVNQDGTTAFNGGTASIGQAINVYLQATTNPTTETVTITLSVDGITGPCKTTYRFQYRPVVIQNGIVF